jgi:LDH2 family malate/lactate/ureidoglycolate dehydrogenase
MDAAIEKARDTGVGMLSLGNGRHIGMLAYTAMRALEHEMIGMVMTAASPRVLPTFGREAKLGTNPIAVAVPAGDEPAFVFDAATSVIPANKITSAHRLGDDLPGGVIADDRGVPILEPSKPDAGAATRLLPLGSAYETGSHKGYGLACVTEILSSLLSDTAHVAKLGLNFANHFVAAMDIDGFLDRGSFLTAMDEFLVDLKSTPPSEGQNRVLVAGQLEAEYERTRSAGGIPLHRDVVATLRTLGARLGVDNVLDVPTTR